MSKVFLYRSEMMSETRERITFLELNGKGKSTPKVNKKGETIVVELTNVFPDNSSKSSLPVLWKNHGYTKELLNSYISVDVYVTDKKGNCWGKYNPQIVKGQNKINFDYMLEVSRPNRSKILDAITKLAFKD